MASKKPKLKTRGLFRAKISAVLTRLSILMRADFKNAERNNALGEDNPRFIDLQSTQRAVERIQARCTELLAKRTDDEEE